MESTPALANAKPTLGTRLKEVIDELLPEGFAAVLLLGFVGLSKWLLEWWIGANSKFFDVLPVKWVFDAGELIVILNFLWRGLRKLR